MDEVIKYLHEVFDPLVLKFTVKDPRSAKHVEHFLIELENQVGDFNVARMAVCMCMDLMIQNANPEIYYKILEKIDSGKPGSLITKFHNATLDKLFYYAALPDENCFEFKDQYVRVMTVNSFQESYVPSIKNSILAINTGDDLIVEELYLNTGMSIPFIDDKRTMRGVKDCAWILPKSELLEITNGNPRSAWADIFVDRAGFYIGEYPVSYDMVTSTDTSFRYMYLLYPPNFSEPVYKPLALHADWRDPVPYPYISSKNLNGWGLTFNMLTAGLRENGLTERIHLPFFLFSSSSSGSQYEFVAYGGSSLRQDHSSPNYSEDALVEALLRYKELITT